LGRLTVETPDPRSAAEVLIESGEFAFTWEAAKSLAQLERRQANSDVLDSWSYLTARCDVRSLLQLARLVWGVAALRYCTSRSVEDPKSVARAVRRLIEKIERGRHRAA
jgi:hypothetical protein